jgi:nucleoside-diphosphate-sugar epimerase
MSRHVLLAGASSQIGFFLLPRLREAGFSVTALSRRVEAPGRGLADWRQVDLRDPPADLSLPGDILFSAAPLSLLPGLLDHAPEVRRLIAFSSTSRFTKAASPDPQERAIAAELAQGEERLIAACEKRGIAWTLFRPTLIYGCGLDRNVTFIARFIRRFGFFPLAGNGLRQPVHADDLALACLQALDCHMASGQAYNLSGGETLPYAEMVAHISREQGIPPRLLRLPLWLLAPALRTLAWLPPLRKLSPEMLTRMNQDLCFDHAAACRDFGYAPRKFRETKITVSTDEHGFNP